MSNGECRYAVKPYKQHFACFRCRKAFKEHKGFLTVKEHAKEYGVNWKPVCPDCGGEMVDMGLDFRAPRKAATKQWKAIEELYRNGIAFHSMGWAGPGIRPTNSLRDAKDFAKRHRKKTEGEQLLERPTLSSKRKAR